MNKGGGMNIENVGLPKWPAMVVVGENVTKEQAAEIIIRTGCWPLHLNDKQWETVCNEVIGLADEHGIECGESVWDKNDAILKSLGVLELEYLHNNQVGSCWIGGPHGWCHWNGVIFSSNSNIGKWPSAGGVLLEWQTIAEAFPFLSLRCQLMDREAGEDGPHHPLVEYAVSGGNAEAVEPKVVLAPPVDDVLSNIHGLLSPGRERGCTEDVLRWAINLVKAVEDAPK